MNRKKTLFLLLLGCFLKIPFVGAVSSTQKFQPALSQPSPLSNKPNNTIPPVNPDRSVPNDVLDHPNQPNKVPAHSQNPIPHTPIPSQNNNPSNQTPVVPQPQSYMPQTVPTQGSTTVSPSSANLSAPATSPVNASSLNPQNTIPTPANPINPSTSPSDDGSLLDNHPSQNNNLEDDTENNIFLDSLTLSNESVSQVLALLGKWTDRVIIEGEGLPKNTINLDIPMPLSFDEAVAVLKSTLAAHRISVVPLGDKNWKAVPSTQAKSNAPMILKREDLLKETTSQEICCCLFRLNNLTAREGARTITPWVTPMISSIVTLDKANSLFITDTLANLQQLDRIFQNIDKVGNVQEAILWFHPKNASAEHLKKTFEDLQNGALKYYLLGNTSFAADKNTNSLVVVTPKDNEPMIRSFFEKFDTAIDPLVQHHVFRILHGSSKDITELIKKLMQGQKEASQASGQSNDNNASTQTFSKHLSVECDERLNAIVAYGTPSDIRQIQHLLDQVDVVLPQVRIEVVIAEVKLGAGQASGLESFGYQQNAQTEQRYDKDGKITGDTSSIPHQITTGFSSLPGGLSIGSLKSFWPKFGIEGVLNAAKTNSNIKIVSSPTLLTTHAREATLSVVETRPYISSLQTKTGSGANDGDVTNSNVVKEDAGIVLSVKPLIGLDGTIQLEIDQKIDNFTTTSMSIGSSNSKIEIPFINKRQIKSFISVQSNEMIAIAGLKKKDTATVKKKVLLLGDLPLLGELFTSRSKQTETTELIVFIRPVLLPDHAAAKADTEAYKSNLTSTTQEEINTYQQTGRFSQRDFINNNDSLWKRMLNKEKEDSLLNPNNPTEANLSSVQEERTNLPAIQENTQSPSSLPSREQKPRTLSEQEAFDQEIFGQPQLLPSQEDPLDARQIKSSTNFKNSHRRKRH